MKDIKNIVTTIIGLLMAIAGAVLSLQLLPVESQPDFSPQVYQWCTVVVTVGAAVVAFLTGRNPDGTKKSKKQLTEIKKDKNL